MEINNRMLRILSFSFIDEEFVKRISDTLKKYPYIVIEEDGLIKGYA